MPEWSLPRFPGSSSSHHRPGRGKRSSRARARDAARAPPACPRARAPGHALPDRRSTKPGRAPELRAPASSCVARRLLPRRPWLDSTGGSTKMRRMPGRPPLPLPAIAARHKHLRATASVLFGVLLALGAGPIHAESLADLLAAVATNARFDVPARADVHISCSTGCEAHEAIFLGRGDALYVEVKDGARALVRPGDVLVTSGGPGTAAPLDARLADSGVLLRDLTVFTSGSLALPQISDDGPSGVVVTSGPAGRSPYVLLVLTIDRERRAIVKTQYYTDSIGHLAKIRRDGGFTQVSGRWRPAEVTVEAFDPGRTTHLTLAWREAPDTPARLFEPAGLEQPSGLK